MNGARIVYHIARADLLERVRRYSFLVMLGAVVFLGYQAAIGNFTVQLGNYRGEFNSAWIGSMLAIIGSFMLGWFGFYLVKGSVARDHETGVGQIMAATPMTRPMYMFGKWISNFAVFLAMVVVLAIAGIVIQGIASESRQFDLPSLLAPFIFIALPMLALTAALAVLFESIRFLQGGFGNLVYFILFGFIISMAVTAGGENAALDPIGFHVLQGSMADAAKAAFPDYGGEFVIGSTGEPITGTFAWSGVKWTSGVVLTRFMLVGVAASLALAASIFFDRFDSSRSRLGRVKAFASVPEAEPASVRQGLAAVQLTPLNIQHKEFSFPRVLSLELKLLFKGQRWWWFAIAAGLIAAALLMSPEAVRAFVLPITWLWPALIWSGLGSREIRHNTQQMVFASAAPLKRQLPAAWLAGFIVAAVTGSGAAVKLLSAGDEIGLFAWLSGALFIPSLALALGVWSNSSKLFEVLHVSLWYLILNGLETVDFMGANSDGNIGFFIPLSLGLIIAALIGRTRQIQN
jgi:hypothetical protein